MAKVKSSLWIVFQSEGHDPCSSPSRRPLVIRRFKGIIFIAWSLYGTNFARKHRTEIIHGSEKSWILKWKCSSRPLSHQSRFFKAFYSYLIQEYPDDQPCWIQFPKNDWQEWLFGPKQRWLDNELHLQNCWAWTCWPCLKWSSRQRHPLTFLSVFRFQRRVQHWAVQQGA